MSMGRIDAFLDTYFGEKVGVLCRSIEQNQYGGC
jgi:hypothetical protein